MMILDTHVLIWMVDDYRCIPSRVREEIALHSDKKTLAVSAMSFWEIALLFRKKKFELKGDPKDWTQSAINQVGLEVVAPDKDILMDAVLLPGNFHPDPVDRIIVATARKTGAVLVSKDRKIREYAHVKSFWAESNG